MRLLRDAKSFHCSTVICNKLPFSMRETIKAADLMLSFHILNDNEKMELAGSGRFLGTPLAAGSSPYHTHNILSWKYIPSPSLNILPDIAVEGSITRRAAALKKAAHLGFLMEYAINADLTNDAWMRKIQSCKPHCSRKCPRRRKKGWDWPYRLVQWDHYGAISNFNDH